MHSDWFNGIEIFQGIWQHGENWDTVIPADLKRLFASEPYTCICPAGHERFINYYGIKTIVDY
jgi:hypothetical protein